MDQFYPVDYVPVTVAAAITDENVFANCGMAIDGRTCKLFGTEYCETKCPHRRSELFRG